MTHSITKISHLHFCSNEDAYNRVINLGEERFRIFNTGAPLIDELIDPETPFLELSNLAAYGQYGDEVPSAGIVTGIGVTGFSGFVVEGLTAVEKLFVTGVKAIGCKGTTFKGSTTIPAP